MKKIIDWILYFGNEDERVRAVSNYAGNISLVAVILLMSLKTILRVAEVPTMDSVYWDAGILIFSAFILVLVRALNGVGFRDEGDKFKQGPLFLFLTSLASGILAVVVVYFQIQERLDPSIHWIPLTIGFFSAGILTLILLLVIGGIGDFLARKKNQEIQP